MAAPQDAVVTVSGSVQKFVTKKKKVLSAEEAELYELAQAAGIVMDQEVFKILVDLLKMNVAPLAVFQMLKSMCAGHRLTDSVSTESSSPSIQATHTETRELPFMSVKSSTIPAPLCFSSSALRPPRIKGTKIVIYSPVDACSPLSQGPPGSFQLSCCLFSPFAGKTKLNPANTIQGQSERSSREGSSQRVPRQPSASRMQKSSSSGKSSGGSST
ncbi:mitotic-spindle organizing protein 2B-like isoform X1 [Rana temporaria]|uniref:mitotic-spindle organizing protein 2B-like isoform X1 n=1 Tax=Rana temporaria TaxID=8407 RepID=UPI001AAC51B9|nr:mitotic-spindle organizing protein 2B-like isoform X1 [Rana temporaria]XP_040201120.1 mitotic-spindle organizing protein 2B-like isoform X1 [Rana temporaria]